jgi:hypothetical protein
MFLQNVAFRPNGKGKPQVRRHPNDSPSQSNMRNSTGQPLPPKVLNMVGRTHLPAHCQTISTGFHHSSAAFAMQQATDPYQINTLDVGMGFRQPSARSILKQSSVN